MNRSRDRSAPWVRRVLAGLLAGGATAAMAATAVPGDPALIGCWRSQHVQTTLADQSHHDQNGDCVTEYDGAMARSRCHGSAGDTEIVSSYEQLGQGKLRVTLLEGVPEKSKGLTSELSYSIQDDWMLVERQVVGAPPAANPARQPVSLRAVSVRVRAEGSDTPDCRPRGPSALRIGRTPASSLALTVPAGWTPWLVDPATDNGLGEAVNRNFLVGAFVQQGTSVVPRPNRFVLVLDDVRPGPVPVREKEFAEVKKRLAAELQPARLLCDLPDRACASLAVPGATVYMELVNVKGRVAMVTGTASRTDAATLGVLRKSVEVFVERLRADNAR